MAHGVHKRTSKGKVYYYHRATGTRLKASPDTPEFEAEVAALNATVPPKPAALPVHTLGGLIAAYKRSPEFAALAPDTVKSYQRAFNAVSHLDLAHLDTITSAGILSLRDQLYERHERGGRWLANMVVAVMSVVLGWGVPRGYVGHNAAMGVPKVRRSRKAGVANPSWTAGEVAAALEAAAGGLRKGIALAYYTGMRLKDVVETRAEARGDGSIERLSSKPGVQITVFEAKRLSAILDEPPHGDYLVVNSRGKPFTRSGFQTNFQKLKRKLVKLGALRPDRTFHGLRKSLGRDAAELGFDEKAIAGALGQTSPASARVYTVEASQRKAAQKVIRALERRGKR